MHPTRRIPISLAALGALLLACSDDAAKEHPSAPPARTLALPDLEDPVDRIRDLQLVEDLTEEVANTLIAWGERLRKLDFSEARTLLSEDFVGHDLGRPGPARETLHSLGIVTRQWDAPTSPPVDRDGFLAGLRAFLSPFGAIDLVLPKTKGAEFALGTPRWGTLTVQLRAYGRTPSGGRLGRTGMLRARCEQRGGRWVLTAVQLMSLRDVERDAPLFTDVAKPAGVSLQYPRFGKDGNDSFFWSGAAVADYDKDGLFDIFSTGFDRNRLYRNRGDGTFEELAERAGVASPAQGTGALFFDADNDMDEDLLLGRVGFTYRGETVGGPLAFFESQGDGTFVESGESHGFDSLLAAFSICAADVNQDGWLDVYVCGYNAEGFIAPDSWHQAGNGTPNALFVNDGDGTFTDRAEEAGVQDKGWSYAAAFCDFDEDGDQDLYVANDYGPNRLFVNRGDGTFEDRARELGVVDVGNGMGATFGDDDGDGDLDLYVSNMSSSAGNRILRRLYDPTESDELSQTLYKLAAGNSIYRYQDGRFVRLAPERGGIVANWAWSAQYLDVDLDGDEDIACVNGFVSGDGGADFKDT